MGARVVEDLSRFQIRLSRRLLAWSLASSAAGSALSFLTSGFWRAFGIQALVWGAVDAAIAAAGLVGARRWARTEKKNAVTERSGRAGRAARAQRGAEQRGPQLRRVLWINTGLDVLYVGAGIGLTALFGDRGTHWLGHGWGVAVQAPRRRWTPRSSPEYVQGSGGYTAKRLIAGGTS